MLFELIVISINRIRTEQVEMIDLEVKTDFVDFAGDEDDTEGDSRADSAQAMMEGTEDIEQNKLGDPSEASREMSQKGTLEEGKHNDEVIVHHLYPYP